jgi:hypothetical protein
MFQRLIYERDWGSVYYGGLQAPTGRDGAASNATNVEMSPAKSQLSGARASFDDRGRTGQSLVGNLTANAEHINVQLLLPHTKRPHEIVLIYPAAARFGKSGNSIGGPLPRKRQQQVVARAGTEVDLNVGNISTKFDVFLVGTDSE